MTGWCIRKMTLTALTFPQLILRPESAFSSPTRRPLAQWEHCALQRLLLRVWSNPVVTASHRRVSDSRRCGVCRRTQNPSVPYAKIIGGPGTAPMLVCLPVCGASAHFALSHSLQGHFSPSQTDPLWEVSACHHLTCHPSSYLTGSLYTGCCNLEQNSIKPNGEVKLEHCIWQQNKDYCQHFQ